MRRLILDGGRRLFLGGALGLAVACGGSSPAAPSPSSIAGTWKGTMASGPTSGATAVSLILAQSGSSVSGTWSAAGPDGATNGALTGGVIDALVSLTLTPAAPTLCPYTVNTTVSGGRMTGVYGSLNCTVVSSGKIELTRQ